MCKYILPNKCHISKVSELEMFQLAEVTVKVTQEVTDTGAVR